MIKKDAQFLRQSAFELQQSYNSNDLVRVAGVVQRIKNWWKARFDADFRERSEHVEEAYDNFKGPLSDLIKQLQSLDNAFKGQDPDAVARLVGDIPGIISKVTKDMGNLSQKMRAADAAVPVTYVDEKGKELSRDNLRWVTEGYKKNREVIESLWKLLPEQFSSEVPIGKIINKPVSSFSWYKNYDPSDIVFSPIVRSKTKELLSESLIRTGIDKTEVLKILENGFDSFIDNLSEAILNQGILVQVNFPSISKNISNRRANEMVLEINVGDVALPFLGGELWINVAKVLLHDLGASVSSVKQLSVFLIRHMKLSTYSYSKLMEARKRVLESERDGLQEAEFEEVEPIENEVSEASDGPITKIVKKALIRERLPSTDIIIDIYGQTRHHKVVFAKILSSALREELDADCSIRIYSDNIQVQTSVVGSKILSLNAVYGVSNDISNHFQKKTNVGIDIDVKEGFSSYDLIKSGILEECSRSVVFDYWRNR